MVFDGGWVHTPNMENSKDLDQIITVCEIPLSDEFKISPKAKMETPGWKNEKTKLIASWIVNTPEICESARKFAKENPSAPILYRAWLKSTEMQKVVTPDGISVLDPELHFGELSIVLWTLTV